MKALSSCRHCLSGLASTLVRFTAILALGNGRVIVSQSTEALPDFLRADRQTIGLDFHEADRQTIRLALSRFPQLPPPVTKELNRRGCTVPQVWGATKPGNVIRGSFLHAGQIDWAILCSVNRISSILIFGNSSSDQVLEIGREADFNKLQGVGGDKIGYSRAISPVGRGFIMQHYQLYGGVKPPPIDHLGIEDAFVEKASIVHYFYRGKWMELTGAD